MVVILLGGMGTPATYRRSEGQSDADAGSSGLDQLAATIAKYAPVVFSPSRVACLTGRNSDGANFAVMLGHPHRLPGLAR